MSNLSLCRKKEDLSGPLIPCCRACLFVLEGICKLPIKYLQLGRSQGGEKQNREVLKRTTVDLYGTFECSKPFCSLCDDLGSRCRLSHQNTATPLTPMFCANCLVRHSGTRNWSCSLETLSLRTDLSDTGIRISPAYLTKPSSAKNTFNRVGHFAQQSFRLARVSIDILRYPFLSVFLSFIVFLMNAVFIELRTNYLAETSGRTAANISTESKIVWWI